MKPGAVQPGSARLPGTFKFADRKIQSDSHIPTIFPGQFPPNSYLLTAVGMLLEESNEVHLENKASRIR